MASSGKWEIIGDNAVAEQLREAARYVDTPRDIAILTDPSQQRDDAFAIGPATVMTGVRHVVPFYLAFEAIEEVRNSLQRGDVGRVYGCFTSIRIARSEGGVEFNALLPAVALTLDLLPGNVARAYARRARLFADGDAWFVTLRYDDVIATIEAMAAMDAGAGRELLVEVTGSERVLRAEPMRQAVVVEPLGSAPTVYGWWEDLPERFLRLLATRAEQKDSSSGERLRRVWNAIQQSAESGQPITLNGR